MKYACDGLHVYVCVHKHIRFQFQKQDLNYNCLHLGCFGWKVARSTVETQGAVPIDCSNPTRWHGYKFHFSKTHVTYLGICPLCVCMWV